MHDSAFRALGNALHRTWGKIQYRPSPWANGRGDLARFCLIGASPQMFCPTVIIQNLRAKKVVRIGRWRRGCAIEPQTHQDAL